MPVTTSRTSTGRTVTTGTSTGSRTDYYPEGYSPVGGSRNADGTTTTTTSSANSAIPEGMTAAQYDAFKEKLNTGSTPESGRAATAIDKSNIQGGSVINSKYSVQDELSVKIGDTLKSIQAAFDQQFEWLKNKEKLWNEYRTKTEALLANTPEYKIPAAVDALTENLKSYARQAKDIYLNASTEFKDTVFQNIGNALNTYTDGLNNMVTAVKDGSSKAVKSYEDALKIAQQGSDQLLQTALTGGEEVKSKASDYANLMMEASKNNITNFDKSAGEILTTYKEGAEGLQQYGQKALDATLEGASNILNIAKRQAGQNLPGLDLYQEKLGAETAGALRRIKEFGGGSSSSLGAIADMYVQQQKGLQDLAIQNAAYRDEQKNNLQSTMAQESAMRAQGYSNYGQTLAQGSQMVGGAQERIAAQKTALGQDLINTTGQAGAMDIAGSQYATDTLGNAISWGTGTRMGATQALGDVQNQAGLSVGQAEGNRASVLGGAQFAAAGMYGDTISQSAQMQATGLGQQATYMTQASDISARYADQAYQQNVLNPYIQNLNYNKGMIGQTDPTGMQSEYYGDVAGLNYGLFQGSEQKDLYDKMIKAGLISGGMQGLSNIFSSAVGSIKDIIPFM